MTDQEIIEEFKTMQKEATELNLAIHEAKCIKDEPSRKALARQLTFLQADITANRDKYKAAVQRDAAARAEKQALVLTIHHPKKGYRRFAPPPGTPSWEVVLTLAEAAPEWGVISSTSFPDPEDIPENWFNLPE